MRRFAAGLGIVLVAVIVTDSAAQQRSQLHGTIIGVAVDSIHGAPLAAAFVALEGSARSATTNEAGYFAVDSVTPGTYRLGVFHPLLDILGLTLVTNRMEVRAGDTLALLLATPSAASVAARRCGGTREEEGSAALFGTVSEAESSAPIPGATVLLEWQQTEISAEQGVRNRPRYRAAVTNDRGAYVICGLPDDLVGEARAATASDTSGTVPVAFRVSSVSIAELAVAAGDRPVLAAGSVSLRTGHAEVRGLVTNVKGEPIRGVHVSVVGAAGAAYTGADGTFALTNQPAGSQTVVTRRLGYEVQEIATVLRESRPTELTVTMADFVPLLEEVIVRVRRDIGLERVGFALRQRAAGGFYLRPEDIERRHPSLVSDLLVGVPMLSVRGTGRGRLVRGRLRGDRYGCVSYAIDGKPWTGPDPDDYLNPQEIGAIEVYPRALAPALFVSPGRDCEIVLIWTKQKLQIR